MEISKISLALLLVIFQLTFINGQNKYADKVRECYVKDKTKFDSCLLQFWKDISPIMKTGIPELKIPTIDPLIIDKIEFKEKSSLVHVDALISNVRVIGASNLIPTMVKVDTKARLVNLKIKFPYLNCTGTYLIKGTAMLVPLEGKGPFSLNMTEIDATAKMHIVQRGTGARVSKLDIDFNLKGIFLKVDGLLGGDSVGQAVNNMINDNSHDILQDIKPAIRKKLEDSIHVFIADAFVDMPPNAFIS